MQRRWLNRPELGAPGGIIMVWLFFPIVAGDRGFFALHAPADRASPFDGVYPESRNFGMKGSGSARWATPRGTGLAVKLLFSADSYQFVAKISLRSWRLVFYSLPLPTATATSQRTLRLFPFKRYCCFV